MFGRNVNGDPTNASAFDGVNVLAKTEMQRQVVLSVGVADAVLNLPGLFGYAATYPMFPDGMVLKADLLPIDNSRPVSIGFEMVPGLPVIDNGATYVPIVDSSTPPKFIGFAHKTVMTDPSDDSVITFDDVAVADPNLLNVSASLLLLGGKGFDQEEYDPNQFLQIAVPKN